MLSKEIKKVLKDDRKLIKLYDNLNKIHLRLRNYTKKKYNKVNPFIENLFDWKDKGNFYSSKNVTIYDSSSITGDPIIGENTWIGPNTSIDANGGLEIGSFCSISAGVRILSHDSIQWALSGGKNKYEYSKVIIGNNCFIGANSVITKGVAIGNNCLVAAGAVVTNNFKSNSIIAGVPAKRIGKIIRAKNKKLELYFFKSNNSKKKYKN